VYVCPVVSCTCVEGICLSVDYFCSRSKNPLNNAVGFMSDLGIVYMQIRVCFSTYCKQRYFLAFLLLGSA